MTDENKDDGHDEHYLTEAGRLIEMIKYPRPSREVEHPVYQEFLSKFITPVFGKPDEHGNYIHVVLDETIDAEPIEGYPKKLCITEQFPCVAYMAHHDTVHAPHTLEAAPFKDRIFYNPTSSPEEVIEKKRKKWAGKPENFKPYLTPSEEKRAVDLFVSKPEQITVEKHVQQYQIKDGVKTYMEGHDTVTTSKINHPDQPNINCLGADCTTGVWLILEMIDAGIPGVYVIHAEEEIGRLGAEALVKEYNDSDDKFNTPYYWLDLVDIAISFDRKGTNEIITHQSGRTRCASDEFADSLSAILSPDLIDAGYEKLIKSDKGSFTDSYSYRKNVAECINLCVGYYSQHSASEYQDIKFAVHLRDALIKHGFDINNSNGNIAVERDPTVADVIPAQTNPHYVGYGGHGGYGGYGHNSGNSKANNATKKSIEAEKKDSVATSQTKTSKPSSSWNTGSATTNGQTTSSKPDSVSQMSSKSNTTSTGASQGSDPLDGELMFDDDYFDSELWSSTTDPIALAMNLIMAEEKLAPDEEKIIIAEICQDYSEYIAAYLYACGTTLTEIVEYVRNNKQ